MISLSFSLTFGFIRNNVINYVSPSWRNGLFGTFGYFTGILPIPGILAKLAQCPTTGRLRINNN